MISKFAQLEFKHGEPERGKTMFDSLVSTYPRRVDLWAVYTDMMIKLGDTQKVRSAKNTPQRPTHSQRLPKIDENLI
jgi:ABC-type hemin transport system substrate-binding protein